MSATTRSSNETPNLTGIDYLKYFAAGSLCATLTHGAVCPIDVVKTRIQLEPKLGKLGMAGTARHIIAEEGAKGLMTGFGATAIGYFFQGGSKFYLYEFWKKKMVDYAGGYEAATPKRTMIYLGSAALAEFMADIVLTPLEATRIRTVSDRTYASGFVSGFTRMAREGGIREMYAGFVPILFKQIPFALGQFTTNEWAHEVVYRQMSAEKKKNLSTLEETGITLGCGMVAGVAAAVLSQPADTLLSKINQGKGGKGPVLKRLGTLAAEAGPIGLFSGLGPRIIMTAGLVSGQFFLYGIIKKSLGARPGIEIHKD